MAEEIKDKVETPEVVDDSIEIIKQLKQNTVSKDDYNKLLQKNNELMKAFAERPYDPNIKKAQEPTAEELDKMYLDNVKAIGSHNYHGNLEAAKKLLQLNDDRIRRGEGMVGLPTKGTPTQEDVEGVERTWELMRYAVEKANGSESVYNAVIMDHLLDNNLIKAR